MSDKHFSSVQLLLGFNGSNGATTTTDESGTPKTVTLANGAALTTANFKFGSAALSLDGTNDRALVATATTWNADGNWTVEGWVRRTATGTRHFAGNRTAGTLSNSWVAEFIDGRFGLLWWNNSGTNTLTLRDASQTVTQNNWHHVRAVVDTSLIAIYVDGVIRNSVARPSGPNTGINRQMSIGGTPDDASQSFAGQMDEFRYTRGVVRTEDMNGNPPQGPFSRAKLTGVAGDCAQPVINIHR